MRRPPEHQSPLIFEMGEHGDVLTLLPWGPVSLWGPTETLVNDIGEGYRPNGEDVAFLLEHAQRNLERPLQRDDIVSLRCGIRPLVVPASFHKDVYPLDISRRHRIVADQQRPWISFFGGKLTNCVDVAAQIYASIPRRCLRPPRLNGVAHDVGSDVEMTTFPGLEQAVPSARWCARHEFCHTLTDYLRRRTNISQWVPREGLGVRDEHLPELERIALDLVGGDRARAAREVSAYRNSVAEGFDRVVGGCRLRPNGANDSHE
jgi:glycerol-3-phosphate dehydrogenase